MTTQWFGHSLSQILRRIAGVAVLVLAAGEVVVPAAFAEQNQSLPFSISNESGKSGTLYVYALGHMLSTDGKPGANGYLDEEGGFHAFAPTHSEAPIPTEDTSIAGPEVGSTLTTAIPFGFSGRLYYSWGKKLTFSKVRDALGVTNLVQPVPWEPDSAVSQVDVDFDWVEMSYTQWGLYLNSTQVDMLSSPASVTATNSEGTVTRGIFSVGLHEIAADVTSIPGYEKSMQTAGGVDRLLNPSKLVQTNRMDANYLTPYIDTVWEKYSTESLVVRPWEYRPDETFTGTVVDGEFKFRNSSGGEIAIFKKPSTADVLACDGALSAPNDEQVGPIARSLCADFNRGVLGSQPISPALDESTFYHDNTTNHGLYNHYSAAIHKHAADGKAYAFAFDDVAHQESLVHKNNPTAAGITLLHHTD